MTQVTRQRLRLAVDTSRFDQVKDVTTAAAPVLWRGNDAAFEIALFRGTTLLDISNFASMTLEVKENTLAGIVGFPLMSSTVLAAAFNNSLTTTVWDAETSQHALFAFTGDETNLSLDSALEKTFYLVLSGVTTDSPSRRVMFGSTLLKIRECGVEGTGEPVVAQEKYYTAAECDSRFALLTPAGGNYRIKNGVEFQVFDSTLNQWRSVWFANGTLQFGSPES
jgi:hypothetical protein